MWICNAPGGLGLSNCCAVGYTSYVAKKKDLSFFRFPVGLVLQVGGECTSSLRHTPAYVGTIWRLESYQLFSPLPWGGGGGGGLVGKCPTIGDLELTLNTCPVGVGDQQQPKGCGYWILHLA
jgi:hypothetical protein